MYHGSLLAVTCNSVTFSKQINYTHNVIITSVVYSGFLSQKTDFSLLVPTSGDKPLAGGGLSTAIVELPSFNSEQDRIE